MTEHTEPSMEEILSSIRRILSSEDAPQKTDFSSVTTEQPSQNADVMELTSDMLCKEEKPESTAESFDEAGMELLSEETVHASADKLSNLASCLIEEKKPETPKIYNQSLEDLVSSLLRPYLKEWLDDNLPTLVERIVTKEVKRLTEKTK